LVLVVSVAGEPLIAAPAGAELEHDQALADVARG
jgi:hypothetical protein